MRNRHGQTWKWAKTAAAAGAALLLGLGPAAARPILVELFTSQGCSSCPPADAYLAELAERDDIVALSFNIDYWDYLSWTDTLGRAEHTERQAAYAKRFMGNKYTPQMVVDGRSHSSGGRRNTVEGSIARRIAVAGDATAITVTQGPDEVRLQLPPDRETNATEATVWLVLFDRKTEVAIERGENAGRTITYTNAVREITPVAMWKTAEPLDLAISNMMIHEGGHDGAAVIVQAGSIGPILNTAIIE